MPISLDFNERLDLTNKFTDFKKIINFFKNKENIETFLDGDKITRYY